MLLAFIVNLIFQIILWTIFITVFLSWIPNINWQKQPFVALRGFTELFLSPFRKIIPPIGGLDISPIFAFLFLQFVGEKIVKFLMQF